MKTPFSRRLQALSRSLLMLHVLLMVALFPAWALAVQPAPEDLDGESLFYNHQAGELAAQGKYDEAIVAAKKALVLSEKVYGKVHRNVSADLVTLASLYIVKGDYFNAERMLTRAMEIDTQLFGSSHPEVGLDHLGIANLYKNRGNYAEADKEYKESIRIMQAGVMNNDEMLVHYAPHIGQAHYEYGKVLVDMKDYHGSLKEMGEAAAIYEVVNPSKAVDVLIRMAEINRMLGNQQEADRIMRHVKEFEGAEGGSR
jgi:tetratricopeptide (TPR) repeat protein